jgi:hypothetical protein
LIVALLLPSFHLVLEVDVSIGCGTNLLFGEASATLPSAGVREFFVVVSIGCGGNLRDDLVVVSIGSTLNFRPGVGDDIL